MEIVNEILKFFLNFTTHMFLFSVAFMFLFRLRKNGIWIIAFGGVIYLAVPYLYRFITDMRFFSAPFFMIGWYSTSYVLLCAVLFVILYFSFRVSAKDLVLILCISYVLQNLIFNLVRIIGGIFPVLPGIALNALSLFFVLVAVSAIYLLGRNGLIAFDLSRVKTPIVFACSIGIIVLLTVLSQWLGSLGSVDDDRKMGMYLYAEISSLLLLIVLICIFTGSRLRYENTVMNELFKKAERQQKVSRENIEYINDKIHDMKHQIAAIKQLAGQSLSPDLHNKISELEKTAKVYDNTVLTGNNILDSLLAEQKIYCESNSIQLDYLIDGSALNFIEPVDLYVIFGNAFDNAVESVLKIHNADERIITINVGRSGKFVSIQIENPYTGELVFDGGIPHTSKEGKSFHGFGIKSIKFLVKKYGGNVTIAAENNRFTLSMLIPYSAPEHAE